MTKCIVTGVHITLNNDSAAHVIPSALGGRLKPKGFLSTEGNGILNDKVDSPLIRTLGPFMSLLGGSRDKENNAPISMESGGTTFMVNFGEPIRLARPEYQESVEDGKTVINIKARTTKEARQMLGRVKAKHPEFDVDTALASATVQSVYLDDMLGARLNLGPNPIFPAVFAMANVYSASLGMPTHPAFCTYIQGLPDRIKFEPEGQEVQVSMPPDTFYWLPRIPPFERPPGISHVVSYYGDPDRKQALFHAELFNLPGVAVVLPYFSSDPFNESYAVDILSGAEQRLPLDRRAYSQPWESTHETSDLFDIMQQSVGRILGLAMQRMRDQEIERIILEVVGEETVFTAEHIGEISARIAQLAVRLMRSPTEQDAT